MRTMMTARLLTVAALTAGTVGMATTAHAGLLEVQVFDNGVLISGSNVSSATGAIGFTTVSDTNFSNVTFDAQGFPVIPNPDLSTVTLDATAASGVTLPATLMVEITQTGLTAFSGGILEASDTTNALIGSFGAINQSVYLDPTNTAFGDGAGTLLNSHDVTTSPDDFAINLSVGPGLTTFSETQIYSVTFNGGDASYGGAMQLKAVPEPASLAILGAGLAGLGWLRRRPAGD